MERVCVHIRGQLGSLGHSIIQRLLRGELDIIVQDDNYENLKQLFSTELEFSKSKILSSSINPITAGNRVLLLGFENYCDSADDPKIGIGVDGAEVILVTPRTNSLEIDSTEVDCHIVIHDMMPSNSSYPWMNQTLDHMAESLVENMDYDATENLAWWVAEVDVADAISRLVLSNHPSPSKIDIAGRRSWSEEQVFDELKILYNRTVAGQSGDFTTEHLSTPSTPNIEMVPVGQSIQSERPDLNRLQQSLVLADGEGWRPMTPIRTALMHFLIGKMN
tara:strand:- start:1401 stop:2231 length:831 start_codon:yes stop_codon:yes gene_type:complete